MISVCDAMEQWDAPEIHLHGTCKHMWKTAGAVMLPLKTDKHHTGCGGRGKTVHERWSSSMREESRTHVFCL